MDKTTDQDADLLELGVAELVERMDRAERLAAKQQERLEKLQAELALRDRIIAKNAEVLEMAIAQRRDMRDRALAAESRIAELERDRNEALAVCYAVGEWLNGSLSAHDVQATYHRCFPGDEPEHRPRSPQEITA